MLPFDIENYFYIHILSQSTRRVLINAFKIYKQHVIS